MTWEASCSLVGNTSVCVTAMRDDGATVRKGWSVWSAAREGDPRKAKEFAAAAWALLPVVQADIERIEAGEA